MEGHEREMTPAEEVSRLLQENEELKKMAREQMARINTLEHTVMELRSTIQLLSPIPDSPQSPPPSPSVKKRKKTVLPTKFTSPNRFAALSDEEMEESDSTDRVVSDKPDVSTAFPPLPPVSQVQKQCFQNKASKQCINSQTSTHTTVKQQTRDNNKTQDKNKPDSTLIPSDLNRTPPIVLRDPNQWKAVHNFITNNKINFSKARNTPSGIKIEPSLPDDHRAITKFLEKNAIPYHTYQLPDQKLLRVVVRNVPTTLSIEDIKEDLTTQGFSPTDVFRMTSPKDKTIPMPMILITLDRSQSSIYHIRQILGLAVLVESQRPAAKIGQCYRCQQYGHSQSNCRAKPRCVKCGGEHRSFECKKEADTPPTCALCGGNHPANYRGCSKAPAPRQSHTKSYASAVQPTPSSTTTPKTNPQPATEKNIADLITSFQSQFQKMSEIAALLFPHFPQASK